MPILVVEGLTKRFGDREAVKGVSFHVEAGETYGLLGPNGAGKTTTISMIAGLLPANAGSITVVGRTMTTTTLGPKQDIGLVPQDVAVYPDLTARENLRFFGRLYGMSGARLDKRVSEVLSVIGLSDRAKERANRFSGGMKRRLNIGIALLHAPRLLILDEPTVGVDPQSRNAILDSVERLSGEGSAILYTTHYMEEAERLCDRIAIIDQGTIIAEGTKDELVHGIGEHDRIIVRGDSMAGAEAAIAAVDGVVAVKAADGVLQVSVRQATAVLPQIMRAVSAAGAAITGVSVEQPGLETVFLHLTGKALRD